MSTNHSMEQVYARVVKGDPMTGEPPYEDLEAAGSTEWRKGQAKRWPEWAKPTKWMREMAVEEGERTGKLVSPLKYARIMDKEREGDPEKERKPLGVSGYLKSHFMRNLADYNSGKASKADLYKRRP